MSENVVRIERRSDPAGQDPFDPQLVADFPTRPQAVNISDRVSGCFGPPNRCEHGFTGSHIIQGTPTPLVFTGLSGSGSTDPGPSEPAAPDRVVPGAISRRLAKAHLEQGNYEDDHEDVTTVEGGANVVTSLLAGDDLPKGAGATEVFRQHAPVLDLDVAHVYLPSSTPGHAHLLIDEMVPDEVYWRLLGVMVEAGLLERGYVEASKSRGYTSARLPWVRKEPPPAPAPLEHDAWCGGKENPEDCNRTCLDPF